MAYLEPVPKERILALEPARDKQAQNLNKCFW